jgi:hypothetical protein
MPGEGKRALLYREKREDAERWTSWKVAELGIPSLLAKAQDRPDEYEVEEVVAIDSLPQAAIDAISGKEPDGLNGVEHVEVVAILNAVLDAAGPALPREIAAGARGWLETHHPAPTAYMAAMRSMAEGASTEEGS